MTLQGLPTIRAYGKQIDLLDKFYEYQNKHTQAWYLYIVTTRYVCINVVTLFYNNKFMINLISDVYQFYIQLDGLDYELIGFVLFLLHSSCSWLYH